MSKPDRVADDQRVADEVERLAGGLGGRRGALDVLVGDAVHLVADDRPARVDEGRPAVDDLAALDLDRGDLDEVGHLRVGAGRLDVDDDELALGVGRPSAKSSTESVGGSRYGMRLALPTAFWSSSWRSMSGWSDAVAEQDGLGHDVLGQELGAGLDHHDRVARAGDDQVELASRRAGCTSG